jgi:hypothetical protein
LGKEKIKRRDNHAPQIAIVHSTNFYYFYHFADLIKLPNPEVQTHSVPDVEGTI